MSLVSFFGTWILQCHAGTHSSYIQQLLNTWCFGIYYSSVTFMCCVIITLPSRAVAKYCNQHVCVCVCLSTRIPPKPHTCNLYQIFCACCLWPWLGSPPAGWWNPKWKGKFCGFFPTDNALYSRAFGTHSKTAELIEMSFWMKTQVGPWNHVLDGVQIPKEKWQFWGLSGSFKQRQSLLNSVRRHASKSSVTCRGWNAMQLTGAMRWPMKPSWYLTVLRVSPEWFITLTNCCTDPLQQPHTPPSLIRNDNRKLARKN